MAERPFSPPPGPGATGGPVRREAGDPSPAVQLWLPIGLRSAPSFANFVPGANTEALHWVELLARGEGPEALYLWGGPGVGKTHLLEAACREAAGRGEPVACVPLAGPERLEPALLGGLESAALVMAVAGWILLPLAPLLYRRMVGHRFSWRSNGVLGSVLDA